MAKSLKRREQANQLLKSYKRMLKLHGEEVKNLSFGRIFKSDPWDCGDPGCYICHAVPKRKGHPVKVQKELDSFKDQLESLD